MKGYTDKQIHQEMKAVSLSVCVYGGGGGGGDCHKTLQLLLEERGREQR